MSVNDAIAIGLPVVQTLPLQQYVMLLLLVLLMVVLSLFIRLVRAQGETNTKLLQHLLGKKRK